MISIIVPVYNVEKYLKDCLESICSQVDSSDEVILINDGSTDASESICREYVEKYPNFILISQINQGLSAARNAGIHNSSKEYMMFVDSDDYIADHGIQVIKSTLSKNRVDALLFGADIKNELQNNIENGYRRKSKHYNKITDGFSAFREQFYDNYIVSVCLAVYRRSFIEKERLLFPVGIYFEDTLFHLEFMSRARTVLMIEDRIYIRRYRPESIMTGKNSEKKCKDYIIAQQLVWDYIKAEQHIFTDSSFVKDFLSFWVRNTLNELVKDMDMEYGLQMQRIFFKLFMEYWKDDFIPLDNNINHIAAMYEFVMPVRDQDANMEKLYIYIKQKMIDYVVNTLEIIPFNRSDALIGIYGLGAHTKAVVSLYEEYVGPIESKFFYIQTKKNTEKYDGRNVVCVDEIDKDVDCIVVSSKVYQDDMDKSLLRMEIPREKIILFYDSKNFVDLINVREMLNKN